MILKHVLTSDADLRLFMPYHAAELSQLVLQNVDHLQPWLSWVSANYDEKSAQVFINNSLRQLADNNGMHLGVFFQGQLAGAIGYGYWNWRARRTELGYWLGRDFTGQGLMTRAVAALTDYAFEVLALNRLEVRMAIENKRSAAIPERLAFTYEGIRQQYDMRDGVPVDTRFYYVLAGDWHSTYTE